MGDDIYWFPPQTADATPKSVPAPKSNETRIVEALESIASEMFHMRRHLESLTDGGGGWGELPAAIRTTGR